eukprot:GHVS01054630.1.p1 GENE.GHVS01054630.1~~GHVS01054630.1.p1  ORF type:complete len:345 (-),score=14.55 GHVS01054630.1:240-1274(-)
MWLSNSLKDSRIINQGIPQDIQYTFIRTFKDGPALVFHHGDATEYGHYEVWLPPGDYNDRGEVLVFVGWVLRAIRRHISERAVENDQVRIGAVDTTWDDARLDLCAVLLGLAKTSPGDGRDGAAIGALLRLERNLNIERTPPPQVPSVTLEATKYGIWQTLLKLPRNSEESVWLFNANTIITNREVQYTFINNVDGLPAVVVHYADARKFGCYRVFLPYAQAFEEEPRVLLMSRVMRVIRSHDIPGLEKSNQFRISSLNNCTEERLSVTALVLGDTGDLIIHRLHMDAIRKNPERNEHIHKKLLGKGRMKFEALPQRLTGMNVGVVRRWWGAGRETNQLLVMSV